MKKIFLLVLICLCSQIGYSQNTTIIKAGTGITIDPPSGVGVVTITADGGGGGVPTTRNINTTAPLAGGGNLSADRTLSIPKATAAVDGYLAAADFTTFNNKVSTSRSISTTAPLSGGGDLSSDRTLTISQSGAGADGYLSSTDWNTFNNKVATSRTISTTAPLTGGGDLSANRTFAIPQANGSTDGYLAQGDWTTFNNKQPAGAYAVTNAVNTFLANQTIHGTLTVTNLAYQVTVITPSTTPDINFNLGGYQTLAMAQGITFTTSQRAAGKSATIKITGASTNTTIAFPAWKFVGSAAPTTITSNKVAILAVTCFGNNDTDIVAAYSVEP